MTVANNPTIDPINNRIDIAASGQTSFSYDGAGNLKHDHDVAGHAFAYDGENRQKSYDGGASSGGGASYYYDGDGRRVKKVIGGSPMTTTVFVYNVAGQLVAEYTDVSPSGPGGTSYLTSDTLGSPRVVTGSNQEVRGRHDYQPFGEELLAATGGRTTAQGYTGDYIRQKFTGYERDNETSLDYAQARYYASAQGRFTGADPLLASGDARRPQTWNRYAYVLNNPLKLVDPTGMSAQRPSPEDTSADLRGGGGGGMMSGFDAPREWIEITQVDYVQTATAESVANQAAPQNTELPTRQLTLDKIFQLMDLANTLKVVCKQDVIDAMKRAWSRTQNGISGNEAGFVLNGSPSKYSIVDTKSANTPSSQRMEIFSNTFLLFHVHPNRSTRNPSTPENNVLGRRDAGDTFISDTYQRQGRTILFLVGHRTGMTMYDPRTKDVTDLRKNLEWTEKCK